jgi:hypothetical protein
MFPTASTEPQCLYKGDLYLYLYLHLYLFTSVERLFNPLNAELNPICYLLALLAQNFLHVSRIRVKMYIYGSTTVHELGFKQCMIATCTVKE